MAFGKPDDGGLQERQRKAADKAERDANRMKQRASSALRAARAGAGALAFAGPAGLTENLGAGGVRNG